jgi:hypothetical protein
VNNELSPPLTSHVPCNDYPGAQQVYRWRFWWGPAGSAASVWL